MILLVAFLFLLYREQFVIVIYNEVLFIIAKIAKLLAYINHKFKIIVLDISINIFSSF